MDRHVRFLSRLNVAFGTVGLIASVITLIVAGGPGGLYASFLEPTAGLLVTVITMFNLLIAIPCILGGRALPSYNDSVRVAMIIVSAVNIINLPVGTILGAYGLWVLMTPETEPLFLDTPPGMGGPHGTGKGTAHTGSLGLDKTAGPAKSKMSSSRLKRAASE